MPYELRTQGDKTCVAKVGASSTMKCYPDRKSALAYQRALTIHAMHEETKPLLARLKGMFTEYNDPTILVLNAEDGIVDIVFSTPDVDRVKWLAEKGLDDDFDFSEATEGTKVTFSDYLKRSFSLAEEDDLPTFLAEDFGASWESVELAINTALSNRFGYSSYARATYGDHVVYSNGQGGLYDINYSIDNAGIIELKGESRAVVATYKKLAESFVWGWGTSLSELAEGKPVQVLRTGKFSDPDKGEFELTSADLRKIARRFRDNARGQQIPVNVDHNRSGGAIGWFKDLTVKGDSELWATIDWTEEGTNHIQDGRFKYFSSEIGPWTHPETGHEYDILLMGGAITNFPFVKDMAPITLSEFTSNKDGKMTDVTKDYPTPVVDPVVEAAPTISLAEFASLRTQLTEATEANKKLAERIALTERESLVRRLTERVHGSGDPNKRWVTTNEDQTLSLLTKLAESFGEDSAEFKQYVEEQEAHAVQIRANFQEVGTATSGTSTTTSEFDVAIGKFLAENPGKAYHEAVATVARANPKLYKDYNAATVQSR